MPRAVAVAYSGGRDSTALLHATLLALPDGPSSLLAGVAVFAVAYALAARFILREEYGYVMRAFTRRREA